MRALTRDANFGFDEERVARLLPVSVWIRKTRGKMERFSVESCVGGYHVYKARTLLVLAYLHESASENFVGGKFRDARVSHRNNPLYGITIMCLSIASRYFSPKKFINMVAGRSASAHCRRVSQDRHFMFIARLITLWYAKIWVYHFDKFCRRKSMWDDEELIINELGPYVYCICIGVSGPFGWIKLQWSFVNTWRHEIVCCFMFVQTIVVSLCCTLPFGNCSLLKSTLLLFEVLWLRNWQ